MIRIVTYNVHKCCGLDRRVRPSRIAEVLHETKADIVALQEVWSVEESVGEQNQAAYIARELGMDYRAGENRRFDGGAYGNMLMSRLPLVASENYDITWRGRERRGCLRVDVKVGESVGANDGEGERMLHIFNVHLGTAFVERRHQARTLLGEEILGNRRLQRARIVLGDFNEWTRGLASRLLSEHFESADLRAHLTRTRTYPGVLPLLHLDHVYFDSSLELTRLTLHRTRQSLVASDHLPLIADFRFK